MIQTTQHVKISDHLNTTVAELGPAQPRLVSVFFAPDANKKRSQAWMEKLNSREDIKCKRQ